MRSVSVVKKLHLGIAVAAVMFGAAAGNAATTITAYTQPNGAVNGTLSWDNPYWFQADTRTDAAIGRFALTTQDTVTKQLTTYQSYCIDIFQDIAKGEVTSGSLTDYLSSYGSAGVTKANQINALIANGNALVTDAVTSAAMQMAIWEIAYDYSGTSAYSLKDGVFKVSGSGTDLASAITKANDYVGKVTSNVWKADTSYTLTVLKSDKLQDQLIFTRAASAVPEPATWAMMLVGFGAVGGALRGRRSTKGVVTFG